VLCRHLAVSASGSPTSPRFFGQKGVGTLRPGEAVEFVWADDFEQDGSQNSVKWVRARSIGLMPPNSTPTKTAR
jgi:hypothetical protein